MPNILLLFFQHVERSLSLPRGSIEESVKVDTNPMLEAGVPSVDIEGMQGDAPDLGTIDVSARKPRVNMSEPQISGPNAFSDVDLSGPSATLDIPSNKKKSGKCFSCASGGDKDEPYSKGRANAGLDLDRPDMRTDGKVAVRGSGPDVSVPSANARGRFSGPSVNGEGFDFDSSGPAANISGGPKPQLDTKSPDIKTPEEKLRGQLSGPDVDISTGKRNGPQGKLDAPTAGLDLSSKKKKGGNCFSCAGGTDKDEPYKQRKGNANFGFDRPDGSMEMTTGSKFDVSGSGPNIEQKEIGLRASASDVDLDVNKERNMDIFGPSFDGDVDGRGRNLPKGRLDANAPDMKASEGRPELDAELGAPSPKMNLPRSKRKGGNCLTCTGTGDKDEPYRKARNVGYSFDGPDVDESVEMKNVSGPSVDGRRPDGGISVTQPKAGMSANIPDIDKPEADLRTGVSGPDIDVATGKRQGPRAHVDRSSAELDLPSAKKKGESCFSCAGGGEKDEPYKATKSKAGYHLNGPEVDGSMPSGRINAGISGPETDIRGPKTSLFGPDVDLCAPNSGFKGPDFDASGAKPTVPGPELNVHGQKPAVSGPDFDLRGSKPGISGPEFDASGPRPGVSRPDFDVHGPNAGVSGPAFDVRGARPAVSGPDFDVHEPNAGVSGPNLDVRGARPAVSGPDFQFHGPKPGISGPEFDVDSPNAGVSGPEFDISGPKRGVRGSNVDVSAGKPSIDAPEADISGPDVDLTTRKMKDPKVKVDVPSAELDMPSKKMKGGNCLSCTGSTDKEEPYRKTKGNAGYSLDRPEVSIEGPDASIGGINTGGQKDVKVRADAPGIDTPSVGGDVDISRPSANLPSTSDGRKLDVGGRRPDLDLQAGASRPDFDISRPRTGVRRPEVDISVGKPSIDAPEADISGPDVDLTTRKMKDPQVKVDVPSSELDLPSKKTKGGNCLSCTGSADKEEPYRKTKGNAGYSLDGPEVSIEGPDASIGGLNTRGNKDVKVRADAPGIDTPSVGGDVDISRPSANLPSTSGGGKLGVGGRGPDLDLQTDASGPDFDISGPRTGVRRPEVDVSAGKPSIDTPEADISGPDVDISTRKKKDPEVKLDVPSSELDLPSKKMKSGNCLSCTGSADKEEPYRKTKGNAGYSLDRPEISIDGPDASIRGLNARGQKDVKVLADAPGIHTPSVGGDVDISSPSASLPSTSGGGKLDLGGRGPDLDLQTGKPRVEIDANAPNVKTPKGNIQTGISGPDVDVSTGNVRGPKANLRAPSADGRLPSTKKARGNCLSCAGDVDKDEPYGKPSGNAEYKLDRPERDGSLEVKSPGIGIPNAGGKGEIDLNKLDKPKISGPSIGLRENDFGIERPEIDIDTRLGGGDWGISKPETSGPEGKLDLDVNRPDLDASATKPRFGVEGLDGDSPKLDLPSEDLNFGDSMPDFDSFDKKPEQLGLDKDGLDKNIKEPDGKLGLDFNRPDVDVSATKPQFEVKGLDGDSPELDIPSGDLSFGGGMPDFDSFVKKPELGLDVDGFDKNIKEPDGKLDLDVNRPDVDISPTKPQFGVKGLDGDTPELDIPSGDLDFGGSMPDFDAFGRKPELGLDVNGLDKKIEKQDGTLDLDFNRPDLDVSATKPQFGVKGFDVDTTEPDAEGSIHPRAKAFDANFDWGVTTSTPKADKLDKEVKLLPQAEIELNAEPLEGDISVANDYNFDLQSTPKTFPSVDYDEPRSLQRYDEIRPDMELRLLSPNQTDQSDQMFDFEIPGSSLDMGKEGKRLTPKRMSLVKVEENVTVCSASLEDELPSPRKRTLTLDREIKQKIEVVFPEEEGLTVQQKSSTSSSFSSSSDTEANKENKSKRKKKSKLLKALRKSSTSSASSKEDGSPSKRKAKERKSSTSSSSSDDDGVKEKGRKKHPLKGDVLPVEKTDKKNTSSSSSSSDEAPPVVNQKGLPKRRGSKSSSSSSDGEKRKDKKPVKEIRFPEVKTVNPITLPEPVIIQKNLPKRRESKSSSSSSDEEKHKSKKPTKEISAPGVTAVRSIKHPEPDIHLKTSDSPSLPTKLEKKKERKSSTSSSSSDEDTGKKRPVQQKEAKERKASTSSTSSSDNDDSKDGKVPKTTYEVEAPVKYNVEYTTIPKQYLANAQRKDPEEPGPRMPTVVSHSVKPVGPDLPFALEKGEDKTEKRERKSSTSSSSDEEKPKHRKSPEDSKPSMLYQVEYFTNQHKYIVEPHDDVDKPVLSVADVHEDAPEVEFHSVEPRDPEFSFKDPTERKSSSGSSSSSVEEGSNRKKSPEQATLPQAYVLIGNIQKPDVSQMPSKEEAPERKSSTSSSSSEDSGRLFPKLDLTVHGYETVHHVSTPDHPSTDKEANLPAVKEHPLVVVSRSFKRPIPESVSITSDDQDEPQVSPSSNEMQFSEPSTGMTYHLEYPSNVTKVTDDSNRHVREDDVVPVVKSTVEPRDPELSFKKPSDRKSSTSSSSSSDEEGSESKKSPEQPTLQQAYVLISSVKKPGDSQKTPKEAPERKSSASSSSSENSGRLSPKVDVTVHRYETVYHVLTPDHPSTDKEANLPAVKEHPLVVVSRSFKRPMPETVTIMSDDQDAPHVSSTSTEMQFSEPSVGMTYPLDYSYNITAVTDDSDRHVREDDILPVLKSTSVEYEIRDLSVEVESPDNQPEDEERPRDFIPDKEDRASPTWDIQTHTFETVYRVNIPENPATDGDRFQIQEHSPIVVSRSIKRVSPVITPGGDDLEEEPQFLTSTTDVQFSQPSNDFQLQYPEGDEVFPTTEPDLQTANEEWIVQHSLQKEKPDFPALLASLDSPEVKAQPSGDSSGGKDEKVTSPREKSPKETARRGSNSRLWDLMQGYLIERPVMDDDETEPDSEKTVETKEEEEPKIETAKQEPKEERTVYHVSLQPAKLETVNIPIQTVDKEPAREVITSAPKVESSVSKVTPSALQLAPVTVQLDVGGKKTVDKEHHAGWRKQASLPVADDDDDDDPWMRHYSKGLQRGQQQSGKTSDREPNLAQNRGLSLSKVPHVKGLRTSAEREREKPRYSIESRIRAEPMPSRSSTEQNQARKRKDEPGRPSVNSLRSFWEK